MKTNRQKFFWSQYPFLNELIRNWWIFLIVGIIGGSIGFAVASIKKPVYKSRLTFALDDKNNNTIGGFAGIASQFGFNLQGGSEIFGGDNIIEIMKSRRMIEGALLSLDTIHDSPIKFIEYYLEISDFYKKNQKSKDLHFRPDMQREDLSPEQDSLLYLVYKDFSKENINAGRPDRKLSIYEVNVMSPDPKFTRDFTRKLVDVTNSFYTEIRTKKAKETLTVLEDRLASMQQNLNKSISKRAQVQDINTNPAFSSAQVPVQKQEANIQTFGAAYAELFKNTELARFQYLNQIPLLQIIDKADYPMEREKRGRLISAIIGGFLFCLILLGTFWFKRVVRLTNQEKEEI